MSEEQPATLSFAQVKEHDKVDDLWMVIHGKVYDVTKFVDEHPGGEEVLIDTAGIDATDAFEDVGHSDEARDILNKLHVGDLDPSEVPKNSKKFAATSTSTSTSSESSSFSIIAIIAALVGIGYYGYLQYSKSTSAGNSD
ncbi:cytochrome b5-like heme/steroid binding domain-containing protein [Lipomyces japonicus]|uniref:cytochrome b5-like heme/steroid binding domain-containing protein n=1 Tax=Lipomyces japonicus TaxID=56871 RepID=UPI0034CF6220